MTTTSSRADSATTASGRTLTANATLALVLAGTVNTLLHESAHAGAALAFGLTPTYSSFSVDIPESATGRQQIVIALAGPVFSLVLGLVLWVVARNWGHGIVRLFWMWLAALGVMNFVGYCFIAPFARGGDTGEALARLQAPGWVFILVCAVGVAGQFALARRFAIEVKRYAADLPAERHLANLPWLIATAIMVVLTAIELILAKIPAIYAAPVLAYAFAFAIFSPMQFIFRKRVSNRLEALSLRPVNRVALGLVIVLSALDIILVAVGGIRLG